MSPVPLRSEEVHNSGGLYVGRIQPNAHRQETGAPGECEDIDRKPDSDRLTVCAETEDKVALSFLALGREVGAAGQTAKKYLTNVDIIIRKRKLRTTMSKAQAATQKRRLKMLFKDVFHAERKLVEIMEYGTYLDGND